MSKGKRFLIVLGIIAAFVATVIILSNVGEAVKISVGMSQSEYKPGTPEYALQRKNVDDGVPERNFEYIQEKPYLFAVFSTWKEETNQYIGSNTALKQNDKGEYEWLHSSAEFYVPVFPINREYIRSIEIFKDNGKYVCLYESNIYLEDDLSSANRIADNEKLILKDNEGNEFQKLTAEEANYAIFYEILDEIPYNYVVYAEYEGKDNLVVDSEEIWDMLSLKE